MFYFNALSDWMDALRDHLFGAQSSMVPLSRAPLSQLARATLPTSVGNRVRHQLDRESQAFKRIYNQRSACERINSQALDLGIERP
ncbi:MAG: hypothetical protein R6W76_07135, partial [Caldilinea sp.]